MKYTSNDPEFETYMLEVRHDAGQLCIVNEKEDIQRELELELDKTKIRAKRKDGAEHLESADKTLLLYALVNYDLLHRLALLFYSINFDIEEYNNALIRAEDWSPSNKPPKGNAFLLRKEARKICLSHEEEEIMREYRLSEKLACQGKEKRPVRPGAEQDNLYTADQDTLLYSIINYEKICRLAPLVLDSWQNFDESLAKIEDWFPGSKS